ncbi:DUF5783 family protein [Halomarina ordinaria]|uniref:DUF5783 family protein n=1 Tax=Halomarina ordinaria TaxID=3033939 RepID=A0ABD5UAI7_9EURY|nr:DUF5783 family protein [Halomarina sp. PSRA2]
MSEFDPERFEDKYVHYFTELQEAYRHAFERMNERYDSTLIHAIDQQVLNESEPFYERGEGGPFAGEFRIDLPPNPYERLDGVVVERERFDAILEEYVDELRAQHRRVFGFEER